MSAPDPKMGLSIRPILTLAILLMVLSVLTAAAQTPQPADLFATIQALDAKLFDAYNRCDLDTFGSMLADDLEFYHDQTGLSVGRQKTIDAVRQNICGKVHRELVPGTLEVYPLKGFGAVEIGVHRFTHPGDPGPGGEAQFIHIWQFNDGAWKITRVISFDHHALAR